MTRKQKTLIAKFRTHGIKKGSIIKGFYSKRISLILSNKILFDSDDDAYVKVDHMPDGNSDSFYIYDKNTSKLIINTIMNIDWIKPVKRK